MLSTPPRLPTNFLIDDNNGETPGPTKARINNLQNQVSELVRQNHALERKVKSEQTILQSQITELKNTHLSTVKSLERSSAQNKVLEKELERCKNEGDGMRDELHLHSIVQQQKALLALAQEQMHVVELEQRLVQAEKARILRDHKIVLFQAKELDLISEVEEKDSQIEQLETSLTTAETLLSQERATTAKATRELTAARDNLASSTGSQSSTTKELVKARSELSSAQDQISTLENKVSSLETKVRALREKEREARGELDNWLKDEKGKEGSAKKEKRELQNQLRSMKCDLERKNEELDEIREELEESKKAGKEREKALKTKLREATDERDRLVAVEEELEAIKSRGPSAPPSRSTKAPANLLPEKAPREKIRKTSPAAEPDSEDEEEVAPKKKARKADPVKPKKTQAEVEAVSEAESTSDVPVISTKKTITKPRAKSKSPVKQIKSRVPLEISDVDNVNVSKTVKGKKAKIVEEGDEDEDIESVPKVTIPVAGEKKKKRKLLGAQPTFNWDPIMNSGDSVIPTFLSPVKPIGATKTLGTIPRIGFGSMPSVGGRLNKLG